MKKTCLLLTVFVFVTCGCGSSLVYRRSVNSDIGNGDFTAAAAKVQTSAKKQYKEKDVLLYYLDLATLEHDAHLPQDSDAGFALAQDKIEELFTVSLSRTLGTVLESETLSAYSGREYERAMTYVYRAMNFMDRGQLSGALVEARKAVFYLDYLRRHKNKGYNDDPFVQYFASLLFESEGNLSSARIARANSTEAYGRFAPFYKAPAPRFEVPQNADKLGEIIFLHYNGYIPVLTSRTVQVAWNDAVMSVSGTDEFLQNDGDGTVQNAIMAGFHGNAVTVAYPVLTPVPYSTAQSVLEVGGVWQSTLLVHDLAGLAEQSLKERMPGIYARMVARAVVKQVLNAATKSAVKSATDDENMGELAGMIFSAVAAATEKADTRMWFTLPGEVRMSRIFVAPGKHKVTFKAVDAQGGVIDTADLGDIEIMAGQRIFLHHRSGK